MKRTELAAAVGAVAAVLGLAIVLGALRQPFSLEDVFVTLVGVLGLVQGLRYALARRRTTQYATDTGDPEQRHRVPAPGDDVDERLAGATGWGTAGATTREAIRDRVRAAVVETLVVRESHDRSAAEDRVDAGAWTDDRVAAAFVAKEPSPLSLATRLSLLVRGRSRFRVGFDRTLTELDRLQTSGGARGGRSPPDPPGGTTDTTPDVRAGDDVDADGRDERADRMSAVDGTTPGRTTGGDA